MLQFPPLPDWESLHPLVIHFPIALLLLSPLFVLIGAVLQPSKGRPYMTAGLLVLLLGTVSVFVASATGEAASDSGGHKMGVLKAVLETHEYLASETEIVFLGLSAILAGMFVLPRVLGRQESRLFSTLLPLTFLALYSVGVVFLVNTAHSGGRLVHEFGLHATMPITTEPSSSPVAASNPARGVQD